MPSPRSIASSAIAYSIEGAAAEGGDLGTWKGFPMRWLGRVSVCSGAMPLALQRHAFTAPVPVQSHRHGTLVATVSKLTPYRSLRCLAPVGATRLVALLISSILAGPLPAAAPANYGDAPLYTVHFVDREEGWAAGDEGVIWHTIDGGNNWERQPTGVHASLRSICFLTPYLGWVAGRAERSGGSLGVVLFTDDGGLHWRTQNESRLPGVNCVRFLDQRTGYAAGDGTDQFPAGVFKTGDGGRTWKPLAGPRATSWYALDLGNAGDGILAGAWGQLATLHEDSVAPADIDPLGARNLRAVRVEGTHAIAAGQGGLVLDSADSAGRRWGFVNYSSAPSHWTQFDFQAMSWLDRDIWLAGRPGSVILHSRDRGEHWEAFKTGLPLPLNGLFFANERQGWAVGELGSIANTNDGGRSWRVQRRGGQRAAILFVESRPATIPLDAVAQVAGEEGFLAATVAVNMVDHHAATMSRCMDNCRLGTAVRGAQGAAAELWWQFPLAGHQEQISASELLAAWGQGPDRGRQELVRRLVLAIRTWRPNVLVADDPESTSVAALIVDACRQAFKEASDPHASSEQIDDFGLEPWEASKLYCGCRNRTGATCSIDLREPLPRLGMPPGEFARAAAALLKDQPVDLPSGRSFRLLENRLDEMSGRGGLMDGIVLAPAGVARRELPALPVINESMLHNEKIIRTLTTLADAPPSRLVSPEQTIAQVGTQLGSLPEDRAARAAISIAHHYARLGRWDLARQLFLLVASRYPTAPEAAEACRWLIQHDTSAEVRRRLELEQSKLHTQVVYSGNSTEERTVKPAFAEVAVGKMQGAVKISAAQDVSLLGTAAEEKQWYEQSLELGKKLAVLTPDSDLDPAVLFSLQSARRKLGHFDEARQWYSSYRLAHRSGPWAEVAAAESWLTSRVGPAPRPVAICSQALPRPHLDGVLDEPCWSEKPLTFKNAVGDTLKSHVTHAWLAYDRDYLYLALNCRQPPEKYVPPVTPRSRDADLRGYDHVSLILDLDRDYATYFRLEVDQRGCVGEDCWGDRSWNPQWYVAIQSRPGVWQIEAAIPMAELSGRAVKPPETWAFNLVRVIPGKGIQAFSTPADVEPRTEGLGLLTFAEKPKTAKTGK
jgi:photosystem II stability/assembly factor-like uncharacterized protein